MFIAANLFVSMLCNTLDGMITIMIGIVKGLGKQVYATIAYVICFYVISVPCTFLFCFTFKLGLGGLWIGLGCGLLVLIIFLTIVLVKSDWNTIAYMTVRKIMQDS
jgi:MATE family multidrug resistance protein